MEHKETCGCSHEEHHPEEVLPETSYTKKVYILENLGCANCAAKMESKIRELPGVEYAAIVFATKQLRLAAENPDALLPQIQEICASIESEVLVHANAPKKANDTEATSASSKKGHSENEKTKFLLIAGALLFAAGEALEYMNLPLPASVLFLLGYLLLGGRIVMTAGRNLIKGHIFDENFLMSVATIGALIIQEFPEAVGVMLFYRIGEYFEHAAVEKSRSQIMDAVDLRPETVNLVVGNGTSVIPACEAAVGDLVLIRPGNRGTGTCKSPSWLPAYFRLCQHLRPFEDESRKGSGRIHGYQNFEFRGKCRSQQAAD